MTNNLIYKTTYIKKNGNLVDVTIRLNDECKNGHEDFSITGYEYKSKRRSDRNMVHGGAIGDQIAKEKPELAIFNNLHLCDWEGRPMHGVSNMKYHLKNDVLPISDFCKYYRITEKEYNILLNSGNESHLAYLLVTLGIMDRWKQESIKAINLLEELTGKKFKSDATRTHQNPLDLFDKKEIEAKIENGYFNIENIQSREYKAEREKRVKTMNSLKARFKSDIKEKEIDLTIKLFLVDKFGSHDNCIYYKHTNELVFNWMENPSYCKIWSLDEYHEFIDNFDFSIFPDDFQKKFRTY